MSLPLLDSHLPISRRWVCGRISTGSLPYRAAIHAAAQAALAVRDSTELPGADPYPEMQERLTRYARQKFRG
jgi:hypothetical protein